MEKIPVAFDHAGKKFEGYFTRVLAAGNTYTWDLLETRKGKDFHSGTLRINVREEWTFTDQKMEKCYLVDYFREVITAWYE